MRLAPVSRRAANAFVGAEHSHHEGVVSDRFRVALMNGAELIGVVIAGNPIAPELAKDATCIEVVRLCTLGRGGSQLLGAIARAALALGYRRLVSYTRADERGTVYRAAGWHPTARVRGREHDTGNRAGRYLPGIIAPTTEIVDRVRWEAGPGAAPEDPALAALGRRPWGVR